MTSTSQSTLLNLAVAAGHVEDPREPRARMEVPVSNGVHDAAARTRTAHSSHQKSVMLSCAFAARSTRTHA